MNFEYFIAKRIIDSKAYKSSISAPIIKIGIAAIAIGIVVMMIAIATGIGLQHKIRNKVVAFNGHVTITNYDTNNSQESENPISNKQDFYPNFNAVDGIRHIQGVATKGSVIRLKDAVEYVIIKGVGADYDWQYFKEFLIEGRLPDYTKDRNEDLLISKYFANRLKINIGDKIQANFIKENINLPPRILPYTVVGIYDSGFKEYDELYAIGDIRHIQRINKWGKDQVGNFEVFIDDYDTLTETGKAIRHEIPSLLDSKTVIQRFPSVFEWISIFVKNIFGIIGIMILVAGINMITALLVLILERTQMVGILKALGSNSLSIRKIFLYNATHLILLGLFWGNLIGLGLLLAQKYFQFLKFPNPEQYYMTNIPVYINLNYILALNIGTFVLCLLMLLIPSYIITKIAPVKAIRFE
ncbi:FtsX-like permease family protein [uncultured Lacinutrix sp.]|uniref:ABC transporter permease n=1 Tax=uncultured Lacinutrix sp. TaxID=574032 RepID=UPI00261D391E|nr:FtsX-like permease family protein [uncultured Lacinutrix sp.]